MNSNRRDFMKVASAGIPLAALASCGYAQEDRLRDSVEASSQMGRDRKQIFNMSGYAAPALNHLRVGYIGLGNRGFASLKRLACMEGVEVRAIADCYEYPIVRARDWLKEHKCPAPAEYYASEETWKDLVARDDLDFVYVATPPYWHAVMALGALLAGKHAATEVPMTMILEDCWKLVEASEKMKKHCTMLENCCYGNFEAMTINMALQGVLGDIVHGEGAYIHYFAKQFQMATPPLSPKSAPYYGWLTSAGKGNRYPTHGLGPVCQAMKIGCGDRLEYLTSVETDDFARSQQVKELAAQGNPMYTPFKDRVYCGNMNSSLIRTMKGKTILVQYDTVDPRPYSRIHLLSGRKGFVQKYPLPGSIYLDPHKAATPDEMKELELKYLP
ncbi:MAG: Gfo/Idh/MocA family oxidoreductase, partial [Thermoguttaceae bacterium]|nr:Gfo/Idh/MocA family oxidoreductase [Thermoguttaceae bacterium]